jgi:hypothetical protein
VLASPATEAQAALRNDLAVCNSGASPEGRATCLKEAHAVYAQRLHGGLSNGDSRYARNARQRCEALTGADRDACRERMRGEGTTSGSADGGGVLRELVTTTPSPAVPPAMPPATRPATPPVAPPPPR